MKEQSMFTVKALTLIGILSIATSTVVEPTITNTSGEYYIADESSFIDNTINCDSTKNCYIICSLIGSCNDTRISCSSSICDLTCFAPNSCINTEFNINSNINTAVNLLCGDSGSCNHTNITAISSSNSLSTLSTTCINTTSCFNNSLTVINFQSVDIIHNECNKCYANIYNLQYIENINIIRNATNYFTPWNPHPEYSTIYTVTDSKNINISCNGNYSCLSYEMNTNNTSVSVICNGYYSCLFMSIYQSLNDTLDLNCVDAMYSYMDMMVSPLSKHTNILCNGNAESHSCTGFNITVPSDYDPDFISFHFINDKGTNVPYSGSFDGVQIQCLDDTLCTNYTSFPLLYGSSNASTIMGNSVYYYGNISYEYQFQSLLCKSGEECFIHCNGDESCANAFIECEQGSKCHIYCSNRYECQRTVVKAYGDEIELQCINSIYHVQGTACEYANIWLPKSFINGYLDMTLCNQYRSCDNMQFTCDGISSGFIWDHVMDRYICEEEECCPYRSNSTSGNITCTDKECYVDCNNDWGNPYYPPFGCGRLIVDGRASNTLYLNCSAEKSCQHATIYCPKGYCNIECGPESCVNIMIYSNGTDTFNIECSSTSSCDHANIMAHAVDTFNMLCSGGCKNTSVFIDSSNVLDIHCGFCMYFKLYETSNNNVHFLCDANCEYMNVYSSLSNNTNILCNVSFGCSRTKIYANFTKNLLMDCNPQDDLGSDACYELKIYANAIDNLVVNCNKSSCIDTYIEAMGTKISNTFLSCNNLQSCCRMQFISNNMSMVSLQCYGWLSCSDSTFNITNAQYLNVTAINHDSNGVISGVELNTDSVYGILFDCTKGMCDGTNIINVNNSNNINLLCDSSNGNERACNGIKMNAIHISDYVNIWCNGSLGSACDNTEFYTYYVENMVNLTCYGRSGCDTTLDAKTANELNIFTYSNYKYDNSELTVYTPQTVNSTNIYCQAYGCLEESFYVPNGLSDINAIFSGNCECKSVEDCVSKWTINCGNGDVQFNGNKCIGSSNCCSKNDVNRVENQFKDYYYGNVTNCYQPTDEKDNNNGFVICLVVAMVVVVIMIVVVTAGVYYKKRRKLTEIGHEDYQRINS